MTFTAMAHRLSIGLCALFLSGCLVSEEPILNERYGRAAPLDTGAYKACPVSDEEAESADCTRMDVQRLPDGAYRIISEEENEPSLMRFARIGRDGYAVQSSADDAFIFFYAKTEAGQLFLTPMLCADLPAALRDQLIEKGDLTVDKAGIGTALQTCILKNRSALKKSAKAYHKGDALAEEWLAFTWLAAQEDDK